MSKIQLTALQINNSAIVLRAINTSTKIPMLTAIRLANNINVMEPVVEQYAKRYNEVVVKYRIETKDKDGKDGYEIPQSNLEAFDKEKSKFDNEIVDIALSQISIKDLLNAEMPSAAQINVLRWLWFDLDEYLTELETEVEKKTLVSV